MSCRSTHVADLAPGAYLSTNPGVLRSHQIYFEKVHPSLPMIHKYRYLAAMNL